MSSEYCEEEQMHKVKNVLIVTFVVYGVLEMHSMTKTIYCRRVEKKQKKGMSSQQTAEVCVRLGHFRLFIQMHTSRIRW